MNNKLIEEMYHMADNYSGRMTEILMLAIAEIQRQDGTIQKLSKKDMEDVR